MASDWRPREARRKVARQDPSKRPRWIIADSLKKDRRRGLKTDLDLPFVEALIRNGCSYCGETDLLMTLDRINNDLGHIKSNVVAACVRCNLIRRDMPYVAWYHLLPSIRKARELGLFGTWLGGFKKR